MAGFSVDGFACDINMTPPVSYCLCTSDLNSLCGIFSSFVNSF